MLLLFAFLNFTAFAQPVPKITSVSPEWIQRGATVDLSIVGENLSTVSEFMFSGDEEYFTATIGSSAKPAVRLESSSPNVFSSGAANDNKRLTAKLVVSADAPLGAHEIRVVAPGGISNPLTIRVTDTPEIVEAGGKHSLADAQEVSLPVGIVGVVGESDQTDFFKFSARKDEQLILDVQASRLGSALDSSLVVMDAEGTELARSEDANGFDSFIEFKVPADGNYFCTIRDFQHRGGGNYNYHLTIGALPYVKSLYPFGGQRGKTVDLKLKGLNLEGAETMKISLDGNAPGGPQEVRAHTAKGFSNARQFDVSAYADSTEKEPNNSLTNANEISVPGNINGHIFKTNDTDFFKFKVEKGQRFIFEIYASRFGSWLDPLLTLFNAKGEVLQRNDDAMGADARIDQTFGEAGEYFLSVRDLLNRSGDYFGYRISVDPPPPADFSAKLLSDTLRLSRGGRIGVRVEVGRSGFAGAIEIAAEDLPEGVSCLPLVIPANFSTGLLLFTASENAKLGTEPLQLSAIGVLNGKKISRRVQAVSGSKPVTRNKRGRERKVAEKFVAAAYLTVLENPPFSVDWTTLDAGAEQNQTATVIAEVERRDGFSGDIILTPEGFAAGNEAIVRNFNVAAITLKTNQTRAEFKMMAKLDSEIGTRPIFVRADATANGGPVSQWSGPILFRIDEFPFVLSSSIPRLGVTVPKAGVTKSASAEAEFSIKAQRRGLFTDDIQLSLEGLPEGVTATSTNLLRGSGEAGFKLTTSDKAKPGTNNLVAIGVANVNGRELRQRAPAIQLIINPAPAAETASAK